MGVGGLGFLMCCLSPLVVGLVVDGLLELGVPGWAGRSGDGGRQGVVVGLGGEVGGDVGLGLTLASLLLSQQTLPLELSLVLLLPSNTT